VPTRAFVHFWRIGKSSNPRSITISVAVSFARPSEDRLRGNCRLKVNSKRVAGPHYGRDEGRFWSAKCSPEPFHFNISSPAALCFRCVYLIPFPRRSF
jgi:hypothetical protein